MLKNEKMLEMVNTGNVYVDESAIQRFDKERTITLISSESHAKAQLKALVEDYGLDFRNFPKLHISTNRTSENSIKRFDDLDFTCRYQHRFGILDGTIHLAYIPRNKLISLTDIQAVIEFFCQIQNDERSLTDNLFNSLQILLQTKDVMISTEAAFFGVHAPKELNSISVKKSIALDGVFKSDSNATTQFKN